MKLSLLMAQMAELDMLVNDPDGAVGLTIYADGSWKMVLEFFGEIVAHRDPSTTEFEMDASWSDFQDDEEIANMSLLLDELNDHVRRAKTGW